MNLFQKNKSSYYQYSPNLSDIEAIKQLAVSYLKLDDFFQLRARFEGLAFYDRLLTTICSIRTIELVTEKEILPVVLSSTQVPQILSLKHLRESSSDILIIGFESDFAKLYSVKSDTHIILQRNEKSYYHIGKVTAYNSPLKSVTICEIVTNLTDN